VATKGKLKIAGGIAGGVLLIGGSVVILALVAVVVAFYFLFEPWLERHIVETAQERGIALQVGELDWGLFWIRIEKSRFSLIGVKGVRGEIASADIELDGLTPVGIDATGVDVEVAGSAASLAFELSEWTKNHPHTYSLRMVGRDVSVVWRPDPAGTKWVEIEGGTVIPTEHGGKFSVKQAKVAGIALGEIGAAWTKDEAQVGLGFGLASPKDAPVRIQVNHSLPEPTADIQLVPTELAKLAGPLAMVIPVKDIVVRAAAHLKFPPPGQPGPVTGSLTVDLKGYVPPHPVELNGFVFGDTTTFSTELLVSEDRQTVDMTKSEVAAGAFKLRGNGKVTRHDNDAHLQLDLRGDLACAALANAAAQSRLGQAIGSLVGQLAEQALKGSVAVMVRIDADTSDLAAAKVTRTIGVGCGLKPLDPHALDALKGVGDLLRLPGLPEIPSAFPALPSALPPLPVPLPALPWPDRPIVERDAGQ